MPQLSSRRFLFPRPLCCPKHLNVNAPATKSSNNYQPRLRNSFSPEMAANFAMTHFLAWRSLAK